MPEENIVPTPVPPSGSTRFSFNPFLIIAVLVVLVVAATVYFLPSLTKKTVPPTVPTATNSAAMEAAAKSHDVYGNVTKVTTGTDNTATILLKAESGKEYKIEVDSKTKINKFQGTTPPTKVGFKELKNGDRLHLTSNLDLNSTLTITADKVFTIDWYVGAPTNPPSVTAKPAN